MRALALSPLVNDEIVKDAPVAIGVSGGKDSQAAAIAVFRHLDAIGHGGPRILVHSDLGIVEWNDSIKTCEALAGYLGVELMVVRRKAGDLMERWEARWRSSVERYVSLSTVTLVPCWSTPSMRFCTSELKTHVIVAALKKRFKGQTVVNVTGVRRDESKARSRVSVADADPGRRLVHWRPIVDWSVADVFASIDGAGLKPHPAYRDFGMSRVSCRFCIMSNAADLVAAAARSESWDLYRRMVRLESESAFAFQGARWLGDVAPHILSSLERDRLAWAKEMAAIRRDAEAKIHKDMLYVQGWPTRMLTDDEADLLGSVRNIVGIAYRFPATFIGRNDIHERYADLMWQREQRQARHPSTVAA